MKSEKESIFSTLKSETKDEQSHSHREIKKLSNKYLSSDTMLKPLLAEEVKELPEYTEFAMK